MAKMNDLRSNGNPREGKYMIQAKRMMKFVICYEKVVCYSVSRAL